MSAISRDYVLGSLRRVSAWAMRPTTSRADLVGQLHELTRLVDTAPEVPALPAELEGTHLVAMYFGTAADADEFIALVRAAKPGLVARRL